MEMVIVGFACFGLFCLLTHVASFKISAFWIGLIASAVVLFYCVLVSGVTVTRTWEYFPVALLACAGFVVFLGSRKL